MQQRKPAVGLISIYFDLIDDGFMYSKRELTVGRAFPGTSQLAALGLSESIRPSTSSMILSQRLARRGSWVTIKNVVPLVRLTEVK